MAAATNTPLRGGERSRLHRRSSSDQVATQIRRDIITGALRTGDRLRQDDIAEDLGVSRIPVREAIIALDREGWVKIESNRGAYVSGLSTLDIRDHYELRGAVFGLVALRATEAARPDDVKQLARLHRALRDAGDVTEFSAINDRILGAIVQLARSTRLRAALRVTPSIVPERFFEIVPGARAIQLRGLAAVHRAIKAGDADRADAAMGSMLARQGEAVTEVFAATGILSATDERHVPSGGPPVGDTSAQLVARHVRRLVINGKLLPGQRLPQDDIAHAVGVSRIPVREAIIALESEGWLRVEPHRGAFVNGLDDAVIVDHYELYGRYFGFAARRAVERMSEDDLGSLHALAATLAGATSPATVERASRAYLDALIEFARSSRLRVVLRSMVAVVPDNFFGSVPSSIAVQKRGIARLHAAIGSGDAEEAEAACVAMEREQAAKVVSMLHRRSRSRSG